MKVAYLVNQYPGVSHSFIRREIAALEALGVAVARFTIRPAANLADQADREEAGRTRVLLGGLVALLLAVLVLAVMRPLRWARTLAQAVRLGRRCDAGLLRHLAYFAEACLLLRLLRPTGAVHLHAHFGTNPATVALLTRSLGGPPYSFTVHGPEEFDRATGLALAEKAAAAVFVVAVSEFGRSQLFRWLALADWPKVRVVRCGVDAAFLAAGPQPVSIAPRLVCVGRLCEQKGQLLLLEAAARLAAAGVAFELVLAGDGPMRAEIEDRMRRLDLGNRVRITGWLSGEAVRREVLAARALVLPSFAEGLPVVLMEALALGRPVVTTYVAGIPELVRDGECGWLVPAGSVDALVVALRAVLAAPAEELEILGQAGAVRVAQRHDATREAATLAGLFAATAAGDVLTTRAEALAHDANPGHPRLAARPGPVDSSGRSDPRMLGSVATETP